MDRYYKWTVLLLMKFMTCLCQKYPQSVHFKQGGLPALMYTHCTPSTFQDRNKAVLCENYKSSEENILNQWGKMCSLGHS